MARISCNRSVSVFGPTKLRRSLTLLLKSSRYFHIIACLTSSCSALPESIFCVNHCEYTCFTIGNEGIQENICQELDSFSHRYIINCSGDTGSISSASGWESKNSCASFIFILL